jgi:hypothetical protein
MAAERAIQEGEAREFDESSASETNVPLVDGSLVLKLDFQPETPVEPEEREGRRRRRSHARAKTISIRRLSKAEINRGRKLYPEQDYWKPVSRAECA